MISELVELAARVAELERRTAGKLRHGTVEEVDASKHIMRLKLGTAVDGQPFLSPWIPYTQTAGALKVHTPPSKGQQFTMLAPTGDWQQAVAIPLTWSDANPSPSSKGDENVITYGNVALTLKDNLTKVKVGSAEFDVTSTHIKAKIGGVTVEISSGGVAITGGQVTHNGKNIGSTHIHGGVVSGGDLTDVPAN